MTKPDALTVVPGQMVTYHNLPTVPVRFTPPDMTADDIDALLDLVMAAADVGGSGAVGNVVTPLLVATLSQLDLVKLCGCLVGLLDSRR